MARRGCCASVVVGAVVVVAVLAVASAYGVLRRHRSGRLRAAKAQAFALAPDDLGVDRLGERATLVQFSSAFCRPCVATRQVLRQVADLVPGVVHVEIDAESRLDVVRALGIASTPTTLVLDPHGVEVRRARGVPRRDEVLAAVAAAVD